MKIVVDARIISSSTGRYVDRLLHYLQQIDTDNEYVILLRKTDMAQWQPTNPRFTAQEADYEIYSRSAQVSLARQLGALKADLVHFPFQMVPVLYRKPYVVTIHDLTQLRFRNPGKTKSNLGYSVKQKQLELNFKLGIQGAKAIITPSKYVKYDLLGFMPKIVNKPLFVTYEGADSDIGTTSGDGADIKELSGKRFIFYVGTAHAHKNLNVLVESFKELQQRQPDLHLALAGKHNDIYKKFLETSGIKQIPNTHVLGFVSDEQLAWLYKHAAAYVFPSLSEGFGLPGLEAMQHSCPVISSNATCLPEVYEDAALYFDPLSPSELTKAVELLLSDDSLRNSLIKNGAQQVAKYSWRTMAEQTLNIYNQAVDKK